MLVKICRNKFCRQAFLKPSALHNDHYTILICIVQSLGYKYRTFLYKSSFCASYHWSNFSGVTLTVFNKYVRDHPFVSVVIIQREQRQVRCLPEIRWDLNSEFSILVNVFQICKYSIESLQSRVYIILNIVFYIVFI